MIWQTSSECFTNLSIALWFVRKLSMQVGLWDWKNVGLFVRGYTSYICIEFCKRVFNRHIKITKDNYGFILGWIFINNFTDCFNKDWIVFVWRIININEKLFAFILMKFFRSYFISQKSEYSKILIIFYHSFIEVTLRQIGFGTNFETSYLKFCFWKNWI